MRAIVLVSGGIDSTVALWWAKKQGWEIIPLTMNYHGRPESERRALRKILGEAGVSGLIGVPLGFLKEVGDLVREGRKGSVLAGAPEGYIPARNMIFYSLAAHFTEALEVDVVVGGHNAGDPAEFPDSSRRFIASMERLYSIGLWSRRRRKIRIALPLADKDKKEVVRLGLRLGAPLSATWSCSNDGGKPCGKCGSCLERAEAFAELGIKDG